MSLPTEIYTIQDETGMVWERICEFTKERVIQAFLKEWNPRAPIQNMGYTGLRLLWATYEQAGFKIICLELNNADMPGQGEKE